MVTGVERLPTVADHVVRARRRAKPVVVSRQSLTVQDRHADVMVELSKTWVEMLAWQVVASGRLLRDTDGRVLLMDVEP